MFRNECNLVLIVSINPAVSSDVVKSTPELFAAYNWNSVFTEQPFSHFPLPQHWFCSLCLWDQYFQFHI